MLSAALWYVRQGFAVFPCHTVLDDGRCSCQLAKAIPGKARKCDDDVKQRGKHPRIKAWEVNASTDEADINEWWARWPDANIAVACGQKSNLFVVDVDGEGGEVALTELQAEHGELPASPVSSTGRGRHLWFRDVPQLRNTAGKLPTIDTRGDGGYVIVPPSRHSTGRLYAWSEERSPREVPLPEMPVWLVEQFATRAPAPREEGPRLVAPPPRVDGAHDIRRKWCLGALEAEWREICDQVSPGRGSALNRSAYKLGGYVAAGWLEANEVAYRLEDASSRNGLTEKDGLAEVRAIIGRGLSAGSQHPRSLPSDVEARAYRHSLDDARRSAAAALRDAWMRVSELRGDERAPGLETQAFRLRALVTSGALEARDVTERLEDAANRCGLVDAVYWAEVRTIIARGLGGSPPHPPTTQRSAPPTGGGPPSTSGSNGPPQDPLPITPTSELGIGEVFAREVDGAAIFVEEEGGWLVYDGKSWQRDRLETIRERCAAFITRLATGAASRNDRDALKLVLQVSKARGVDAVLRVASSRPEVRRLHEQLDANPDVLNCTNGTIDLRTGALRAHDPKDLITRCAPAHYEPEADGHEDFGTLLDHLTPDPEVREYLQRAVGYSITGRVSEDVIFLLVGASRSGKSTLAHAARGALGSYFASAKMQSFCIQQNASGGNAARSDLVRLRHGRMLVASEVAPGLQLDNGLLKALAGGEAEAFPFRDMYGKDFVARWIGKVWLVCNPDDVPRMRSEDDAFWERARRIPVGRTLTRDERDAGLRERLEQDPAARSAFLTWAVQGAMAWYSKRDLGLPASVLEASEALRDEMDPVAIWCAEHLVFGERERVTKKALRETYEKACEESGEKPVGAKRFAASLRGAGLRALVPITDGSMRVLDKVAKGWIGVRLKTDAELEGAAPPTPPPQPPQGDLEW